MTARKRKPVSLEPGSVVRVFPSRKLGPTEYVPGVPADGVDLPAEEAAPLLEAGVVTTEPPAAPASTQE